MIQIPAAMIEPKFAFLEMEVKIFATNPAPLRQARFGGTPKAFNAVNVDPATADKDAVAMFDAEMFAVPEVDQAVVAEPAVGVNDALEGNATANNRP